MAAPETPEDPKRNRLFVLTAPDECTTVIAQTHHIRFVATTLRLLECHRHFPRSFRTDGFYKFRKFAIHGLVGMWSQTADALLRGYPGGMQVASTENEWAYTGLCRDITRGVLQARR
jgi:hypothetical protein